MRYDSRGWGLSRVRGLAERPGVFKGRGLGMTWEEVVGKREATHRTSLVVTGTLERMVCSSCAWEYKVDRSKDYPMADARLNGRRHERKANP